MARHFLFIAALIGGILFSCTQTTPASSESEEESYVDNSTEELAEEPEAKEQSAEFTENELQVAYDSIVSVLESSYDGFEATISTDAYESSSAITWVIDANGEVLSFKENYAVESMEGNREYFFDHGRLSCYREEETAGEETETTYYCKEVGGFKQLSSDLDGASNSEVLKDGRLSQKEQMISQSFDEFVRLLKEYEVTTMGDTEYTILVEEETNYDGIETTNKTEITIPKELYLKLVGQ